MRNPCRWPHIYHVVTNHLDMIMNYQRRWLANQKRELPIATMFFCLRKQREQINYIFSDNIRCTYMYVYCVYRCIVIKPKITVKFSKKSKNKRRSNRVWWCPRYGVRAYTILIPFLIVAQHESGTRKALSVTVWNKKYPVDAILTAQIDLIHIGSRH
jgi:hypothetical protein